MDPERKQELLDKWHKALLEASIKNERESAQWTGRAWSRWQRQEQDLEEQEMYDDYDDDYGEEPRPCQLYSLDELLEREYGTENKQEQLKGENNER